MKLTRLVAMTGLAVMARPPAPLTLHARWSAAALAPVVSAFTAETGIAVAVRQSGAQELATLAREDGARNAGDVFWSDDAAALACVLDRLQPLPETVWRNLSAASRDARDRWVATSGRLRVMAVAAERAAPPPARLGDLVAPRWRGRIVWAPTDAALQNHLTAVRAALGDAAVRDWVRGLIANRPIAARDEAAVVQAVRDGAGDVGLTTSDHVDRARARELHIPIAAARFADGDAGALPPPTVAGVLQGASRVDEAMRFVAFLLSPKAQQLSASAMAPVAALPGGPVPTGRTPRFGDPAAADADLIAPRRRAATLAMLRDLGIL